MKNDNNIHEIIHELKHFLPAQAPLKDFVHHNTLHAFQDLKFFDAIFKASKMLGYKVSLNINEYRQKFTNGDINKAVFEKIIIDKFGLENLTAWKDRLLEKQFHNDDKPRIGSLRKFWKQKFNLDLDSMVHPTLFRILCSYLDQGISIWAFPIKEKSFLTSIREIEKISNVSIFRTSRVKEILLSNTCEIDYLLKILIGDDANFYREYLFDQQFSHQGWSGLISVIEDLPSTLLDARHISIHDLIVFELLLEIDALEFHFKGKWEPLESRLPKNYKPNLFLPTHLNELDITLTVWQEIFEWSYYNQVLNGLTKSNVKAIKPNKKSFQALFCIDDRECSLRRYLEHQDPNCETFGTPGFFGVEFYYQPEHGKFYTKVCPAPVKPKYLIKETENWEAKQTDINFSKHTHNFYTGFIFSQTLGFWSAIKLFFNIFRPTQGPSMASSDKHMYKYSKLTIENKSDQDFENGLQIGFKITEMADRVEGVLRSIGLIDDFADIVYSVGHGASTINNPHYAAYDCGACSGRAGSVNGRVFSYMANHKEVRAILNERGIIIPETTQFIGALHDTTRDEISFYDEKILNPSNYENHSKNELNFQIALDLNAKERSRRFESIKTGVKAYKIHEKIKTRSVTLFEPRPELNHATNALCIVGRRDLTRKLFLDRRAFLNSYDYSLDPSGKYLINILNAAAPVCGGINLEYYFSRVDNQKLGAGSKLPHNIMGLIGVANGIDGDLRPGLPSQMIEVHDPIRLLMIVEHFPEIVLNVIKSNDTTFQWFSNEWVNLAVIDPETEQFFKFQENDFVPYNLMEEPIERIESLNPIIEKSQDNLPVYILNH